MKESFIKIKSFFIGFLDFINHPRKIDKKVFNALIVAAYSLLTLISFFVLILDEIPPFNFILIALISIFIVLFLVLLFFSGEIVLTRHFALYIFLFIIVLLSCCVNLFAGVQKTIFLIILFSATLTIFFMQKFLSRQILLLCFLIASWAVLLVFAFYERDGVLHPNFSNRIGYTFGDQNYVARDLSFCFLLNYSAIVLFKKRTKWFLVIPIVISLYFNELRAVSRYSTASF